MKTIALLLRQAPHAVTKGLLITFILGSLASVSHASGPGKGNSGRAPAPTVNKPPVSPRANPSPGAGAGNYGVLPGGAKPSPVQGKLPSGPYGGIPKPSAGSSPSSHIGTLPPPPGRSYIATLPKMPAPLQQQIQSPPTLRPPVYSRLPTATSSAPTAGQAVQSFTVTDARSPQTRIMGASVNGSSLGAARINPRVKAPAGNDTPANSAATAGAPQPGANQQELKDRIADMQARRNAQINKPLPQPNNAAALLRQ
jgi:hypothetical protein